MDKEKENKKYSPEPSCYLKHLPPPVVITNMQPSTSSNTQCVGCYHLIFFSWKQWKDVFSESISEPLLIHFGKDLKRTFLDKRSADCLFLLLLAANLYRPLLKVFPCQRICLNLKINFSYDAELPSWCWWTILILPLYHSGMMYDAFALNFSKLCSNWSNNPVSGYKMKILLFLHHGFSHDYISLSHQRQVFSREDSCHEHSLEGSLYGFASRMQLAIFFT